MSKMREPLLFWALDDTLEPGKSYRYRIRLGVFNPQRIYLFAKEIQEAARMVTVQVSKYVLGYWYSKDFVVRQGEAIGKLVELERPASSESRGIRGLPLSEASRYPSLRDPRRIDYLRPEEKTGEPESIDYSTGAVLVDAIPINDWSGKGSLRPRHYFDMLYSYDGTTIERTAISNVNWPQKLQVAFNEIRSLQRESKEPLKDWQSGGVQRARQRVPTPGLEGYEGGAYDDMLYEGMMGGGRRY